MNRPYSRLLLFAAAIVAACDSASGPPPDKTLPLQGQLRLLGGPPDPSLTVFVQAYPDSVDPPAPTSIILRPDSLGAYAGSLGPFPNGQVDSLRIYASQPGCGSGQSQEAALGPVAANGHPLSLPTFDFPFLAPIPSIDSGVVVCGIINRGTLLDENMGVALVVASIRTNSLYETVFGRWDISHIASVGDAYGHFTGYVVFGTLTMDLVPRADDTLCGGMALTIPIRPDRTFLEATLSGTSDPRCYLTPGRLLLYQQDWQYTLP